MSSLVGSVKSLFGSLFGKKRKQEQRQEEVITIQESNKMEEFEYDCDTLPMAIQAIVKRWEMTNTQHSLVSSHNNIMLDSYWPIFRPIKCDIRSVDVSQGDREQMSREDEDEEFSSTEDDAEPSIKRQKKRRILRRTLPAKTTTSSSDWDVFQMET